MYISRFTLATLLGALLFSCTFALHDNTDDLLTNNNAHENEKRDLIGSLLPPLEDRPIRSPPAPAPDPPIRNPKSQSTTSDATKTGITGPLPSLINGVFNPSAAANPTSSAATVTTTAPVTNPKKKSSTDTSDDSSDQSTEQGNSPDGTTSKMLPNKAQYEHISSGLEPGLIALMIIIVLSILTAVAFSCYKIRQARHRRRGSWDEDILKNHAASVGYTEEGGYGMFVGDGGYGKERPDLWRKNLDLFHRV
ncbi:hypothetical protein BGX27_006874 [Mortierella sp. AM989]|nr:hypothetical protein BGX27_006874 [Mortierella sp. AM989]